MEVLSGAFTILTIKENLQDKGTIGPPPGEAEVFDAFQAEENKMHFLELLKSMKKDLAEDLLDLQNHPYCIIALEAALQVTPIRAHFTFRMASFFLWLRMEYVCRSMLTHILLLANSYPHCLAVFMHPPRGFGVLESLRGSGLRG
jgi:hypothetical protein